MLTKEGTVPDWYVIVQEEVAASDRWRDAAMERCDQARDDLDKEVERSIRFGKERDWWRGEASGLGARQRDLQNYNRGVADGKREGGRRALGLAAVYGPNLPPGSGDRVGPPTGPQNSRPDQGYSSQHGRWDGVRAHVDSRGEGASGQRPRSTPPNVFTLCPPPVSGYQRGGGARAWESGATGSRDTRSHGHPREGPNFGRNMTSGVWDGPKPRGKKHRGPKEPPLPIRGPVVTEVPDPVVKPPPPQGRGNRFAINSKGGMTSGGGTTKL